MTTFANEAVNVAPKTLSRNDMRVKQIASKAAEIQSALILKGLDEELNLFMAQYDMDLIGDQITGHTAQTLLRSLEIWYQDFVS